MIFLYLTLLVLVMGGLMWWLWGRKVSPLPKWFILIFAPPGNCKSLEQARLSELVFDEYHRTEKRYPLCKVHSEKNLKCKQCETGLPHRILYTNQLLGQPLSNKELEHGHVRYWEKPEDFRYCPRANCWREKGIHRLHDVDLFIDEGSTLFPSDGWTDTPMWLRKMWAQHRHNGIRIMMLTQDYMGIDINCRRMVWEAWHMHKVVGSRDISPTLPPLSDWTVPNFLNPAKNVLWGVYSRRKISPDLMKKEAHSILIDIKTNEEKKKVLTELNLIGVPQWHLITKHKVELYDTTQDVKEYEVVREIEHIEVKCGKVDCDYLHKKHVLK